MKQYVMTRAVKKDLSTLLWILPLVKRIRKVKRRPNPKGRPNQNGRGDMLKTLEILELWIGASLLTILLMETLLILSLLYVRVFGNLSLVKKKPHTFKVIY